MNKQQLANKIWESANKMRSRIEANDYKDYILGFMFYKYLSEQEEKYLLEIEYTAEMLPELTERAADPEIIAHLREKLGYFIGYENLFSTWVKACTTGVTGFTFDVSVVVTALNAFNRLIVEDRKETDGSHPYADKRRVYVGIFNTLQSGLTKLGESTGAQTKAIRSLITLIDEIPMDNKDGYDILGFIYEYLISNFAANAGKKAGEFYTPHEVSILMSEIIAHHLQGREHIDIYDPTSGSGSLLINIGKSVQRRLGDKDRITYYAQELKENTYNLTRMNLVMRGIKVDNIKARCGDTLAEDWPYFDNEDNREATYRLLSVDAVVSNPPYSQHWTPGEKEAGDPRYAAYGLAPKTKADYAFLLHDLYHLKPDGIMAIVLPHGVLFRGKEEYSIRKELIERDQISAIIGLPANIFFGTTIPTIIMVLQQKRENNDILIIDASKGFGKEGKNNILRARDIRRILDTFVARQDVPKFARVVSKDEIRANEYNLNIPRYVDSSDEAETYDIYAIMRGGVPDSEIAELAGYWDVFPSLRAELFTQREDGYSTVHTDKLTKIIAANADVTTYEARYRERFADFGDYLHAELIDNIATIKNNEIEQLEEKLTAEIFTRLENIPLVDCYASYQELANLWTMLSSDLETLSTEGVDKVRRVVPNMVTKKVKGVDTEVQEGYRGYIIPFELAQELLLTDELAALRAKENELTGVTSAITELLESLDDEERSKDAVNNDGTAFVAKELNAEYKLIQEDITDPEITSLATYKELKKKDEKLSFVAVHPEVDWEAMEQVKNGTYSAAIINKRIATLVDNYEFADGSWEYKVKSAIALLEQEKNLKVELKEQTCDLEQHTQEKIENLSEDEVKLLLHAKWITPLEQKLLRAPEDIRAGLIAKIEHLADKYATTLPEIDSEIITVSHELAGMLRELTGGHADMVGLADLTALLERS